MAQTITVIARHGKSSPPREIKATVGKRYLVSPMNPKKMKHRGRTCVIESLEGRDAEVRFDDNHRLGRVDITDLVPASKANRTPASDPDTGAAAEA